MSQTHLTHPRITPKQDFISPPPPSTQPNFWTILKKIAPHKQYTNLSTKLKIFYLPYQVVNLSTPIFWLHHLTP